VGFERLIMQDAVNIVQSLDKAQSFIHRIARRNSPADSTLRQT